MSHRTSKSSVEHGETDIGIEITSLDPEAVDSNGVNHGECLAWPCRVIQLVKCNDCALGHPRQKVFDRCLCGRIEIKIQKQEADHYVWILCHKSWDGFGRLASHQMNLVDMSEEPILVERCDQRLEFMERIGT